jgi:hypothetical protein
MRTRAVAYDSQVVVPVPHTLRDAVREAASRLLMSQNSYMRAAIVSRLQADGIQLPQQNFSSLVQR